MEKLNPFRRLNMTLVFLLSFVMAQAQSPGGVSSNLVGWFKADKNIYSNVTHTTAQTSDAGIVQSWGNLIPTSSLLWVTKNASNAPKFYNNTTARLLNFNPALRFMGSDLSNTTENILGPTSTGFQFFVVARNNVNLWSTTGALNGILGSGTDGNSPALDFNKDSEAPNSLNFFSTCGGQLNQNDGITMYGGGGVGVGTNPTAVANQPANWSGALRNFQPQIFGLGIEGINTTCPSVSPSALGSLATYDVDGAETTSSSDGQVLRFNASHARGAGFYIGSSLDAVHSDVDIAEVVVLSDKATSGTRRRILSYLAIKYGITLGQGNNTTSQLNIGRNGNGAMLYVASNGTLLFSPSGNYVNNIAGIGRDDASGLVQKQSSSVNYNKTGQVTIALGNSVAATNNSNTANFSSDLSFLMWGDNGDNSDTSTVSQPMSNTAGTFTEFTYNGHSTNRRMNRVWKVQNNGVDQPITIQFPTAGIGTTTLAGETSCARYVLIYSSDPTFPANSTSKIALSNQAGNSQAQLVLPPDAISGITYFTFAKVEGVANGVATAVESDKVAINVASPCIENGYTYYYESSDVARSKKLFAINWNGNTPPSGLSGTIDVNTAPWNQMSGSDQCNIMGRLLQIHPAGGNYTTNGGVKLRFYYYTAEKDATASGMASSTWFKSSLDISDLLASNNGKTINASALFAPTYGTEDGVNYVEFSDITSFSTFGFVASTNYTALPVDFGEISAIFKGGQLVVNWSTLMETNADHFVIEASKDGKKFVEIGRVATLSKDGNSSTRLDYNFSLDANAAGGLLALSVFAFSLGFRLRKGKQRNYVFLVSVSLILASVFAACNKDERASVSDGDKLFVRIKQVDKNGESKYSNIIKVVQK